MGSSRVGTGVLLAAAVLIGQACGRPSTPAGDNTAGATASSALEAGEWFVDRAAATGLDFVHFNGMSGAQYYVEHMGPGVALFDYDNDGDLDVFIPQGQMLGTGKKLEQ